MNRARESFIGAVVLVLLVFLLARVHPFGDAGLTSKERPTEPFMEGSAVPPEVRTILAAKCADCHSMRTQTPLYGRVAPVSWLLERDIVLGRRAMNLDAWSQYPAEQQQVFASKIVQVTREHKMPLPQYRIIHWRARITDADLVTLTKWAHGASAAPEQPVAKASHGDALRGKDLFEKRCTGCHELSQNHEGPKLAGVYGRASGSVGDYSYSEALKKAQIVWGDESLDRWLADPDGMVPGNNMDFLTAKPLERQDIVAFLKQSSGR